MDKNTQFANYTLPGVMRYLQSEWSRNERDRIQWESEKSEMKAKISQLSSENNRLKGQLAKLQKESSLSESNVDNAMSNGNGATKNEFDELVKAREYMNQKKNEVMFILSSHDNDLETQENVLLGLKQHQFYGTEKVIKPIANVNELKLSPSEEELNKQLMESLKIAEDKQLMGIQKYDSSSDVETDTETILGDDAHKNNNNDNDSPLQPVEKALFPKTVFILLAHFSQINQIEIQDDLILTASIDGWINLWNYSKYLEQAESSPAAKYEKSLNTFHHEGEIKILKWLDRETFITLGVDSIVRVWKTDKELPTSVLSEKFTGEKSFDVIDYKGGVIVTNDQESTQIVRLNLDKQGVSTVEISTLDQKFDLITINDKSTAIGLKKDTIFNIDLDDGHFEKSLKSTINPTKKHVTQFKKLDANHWVFTTNDEVIVYNIQNNVSFSKPTTYLVSNISLVKEKLFLFYTNGDIEVYKKPNLEKNSKDIEQFALSSKFNHYELIFDLNWDDLSADDREMLVNSKNLGQVLSDGKHIVSGGEDSSIRCFKID